MEMAELIILGSGTGVPSLKRGSPSLLLVSEDSKILVDSGSGTLRRMLEAGITYQCIDLLLYTHTHPDHIADLVPILFACKYAEPPRQRELHCFGGPGFFEYFEKLNTLYGPWIKPKSYPLTVEDMPQNPINFHDIKISSKSLAHLPGSVGYRFELADGKSLVISGDTDYCQNIVDLSVEADLLVLECSYPDGRKVEGHLTPSLAGRIGKESKCKTLLLTHFYPQCDRLDVLSQCRKVFKGNIIIADDLMSIEI
jgi:ribonuclease BN (tRNA processing enzyme)